MSGKKDFRLPNTIRPLAYDLFFEPDLTTFKFAGKEEISLNVAKPLSEIALNVKDLQISQAKVVHKDRTMKPTIYIDKDRERLLLNLDRPIRGPAKVLIDFGGYLNDDLTGFYRSKYQTDDGTERYLATTDFEPANARKAFPCFDEPEYKATFSILVKLEKALHAVSNMPIVQEIVEGNKKILKFGKTPPMSTYLVYVGVGDFEYLEDNLDNILIRVITTPGKSEQGKFALDIAKKGLSYFQQKFGVKYALPKLDLIAVPDFEHIAMENWGAITFREVFLLENPKVTSTRVKEIIARVIFHEQAHQWFGDLTTMRWWNDLWLNESFATFMAFKAADHYFPRSGVWEDFVNFQTEPALDDDSLKTTHPIQVKIASPSEAGEVFDAISYGKGASVLRMLESYLGEQILLKGVNRYLSQHTYDNATSEDLWNAMARVSDKPIEDVMASWINQSGYPLLEVRGGKKSLRVTQKSFNWKFNKNRWLVPLLIKVSNRHEPLTALVNKKSTKIRLPRTTSWVKLNYGQSGFYRVKSSDHYIECMKPLIQKKKLAAIDRWGIQNDLFNLSLYGKLTLDKYLDLIESYRNEDNFLVLNDLYSSVRHIHSIFSRLTYWPSIWPKFKEHFREPFSKLLDKLGWEPKSQEDRKDTFVRRVAIEYLGFVEEPTVVQRGISEYQRYLHDHNSLSPDLKTAIFCIATVAGDLETYEKFTELYSTTRNLEEKSIFLRALSQFKNTDVLRQFLDFLLTDKVPAQDLPYVFSYVPSPFMPSIATNTYARDMLLPWVKENWRILERYKDNQRIFMNILESIIGPCTGKVKEQELHDFFDAHPVKYKMTIDRAFERMKRNTQWLEKNREVLVQYFAQRN